MIAVSRLIKGLALRFGLAAMVVNHTVGGAQARGCEVMYLG